MLTTKNPSVSLLKLIYVAISRQLNVAPYLHGFQCCQLLWEETVAAVCTACWSTYGFAYALLSLS